ncbi:hypothetical protein [Acetobacter persici]|uniref:hypothetical protein n=1 Tax=Acetobacter persici TaxID=1076596 RepID=UPI0012FD0F8B|nr:hypothetical protein [Acetobacter persici]
MIIADKKPCLPAPLLFAYDDLISRCARDLKDGTVFPVQPVVSKKLVSGRQIPQPFQIELMRLPAGRILVWARVNSILLHFREGLAVPEAVESVIL